MFSIKKAAIFGTVALGIAGLSAYASGTFAGMCSEKTNAAVPAVMTSGGSGSCCAGGTTAAMAHVDKPAAKAQTIASSGDVCPVTGKTGAKTAACGSSATTAVLTSTDNACEDKAAQASASACEPTAKTAALTSADGCCASEGTKARATAENTDAKAATASLTAN